MLGAGVGIVGVGLMLFTGVGPVDGRGVLASVAAMTLSSLGYVLAKRWSSDAGLLASTSWQLIAGGLLLVPAAVLVEGPPPALDAGALLAFAFVSGVATALAFVAWFAGLRQLPAGTVGLLGLLNPMTGVLLGTLVAAEPLSARQLAGLGLLLVGVLAGQPAVIHRVARPAARQGGQLAAAGRGAGLPLSGDRLSGRRGAWARAARRPSRSSGRR